MRPSKVKNFVDLGLTELETYAVIECITTTIEAEEPKLKSTEVSPYTRYCLQNYLEGLKEVVRVLKTAIEPEPKTAA